jgi:hypothetical protein
MSGGNVYNNIKTNTITGGKSGGKICDRDGSGILS